MICIPHQTLYGWSYQEQYDGRGMWHVWGTGEVYTGFWWGNLRERDDFGERRKWKDNIKKDPRRGFD
jgi:hypothetical protein